MSKRTEILESLLQRFVQDGIVEQGNTSRQLQFLHETNDFPACCISSITETLFHYGAGRKLRQLQIQLRGFIYGTISDADQFGRSLENSVYAYARNPLVEEARVISFRTDEGLFEPYGIIDLAVEITYEVEA